MDGAPDRRITVGRIAGLFGVRGWVKVHSHTRPREAILNYSPWLVVIDGAERALSLAEGRAQGKGVIARLEGITDRDQAATLVGADIVVGREQLPAPAANEYYWAELEGARVVDQRGTELGRVSHLFETGGAHDVMVVRGEIERLIPFSGSVVKHVDLAAGVIHVDWEDPE